MAKDNLMKFAFIGLLVWMFMGQGGTGGTTPATGDTGDGALTCPYAPQFELAAQDKWDSDQNIGVGHKYILGDGAITTYSSATEFTPGQSLKVLWGAGNASQVNQEVATYNLNWCGKKTLTKDDMIRNKSMTMQCFNQEGNLIDDTTENETISAGEAVSLECEIHGVNDQGMKHGGLLVVELPTTYYDEEDTDVTGGVLGGTATVPSAYTVSNTALKAFGWDVEAITDSGIRKFTLTVQADGTNDPLSAATTGDILMYLYSKNCYEDSKTGDFDCGIVDEDNAWAGSEIASETVNVD